MKKSRAQSITSLDEAPGDDRRRRMVQYSVAMGIRLVCVLLLFVVHGWWLFVVAIGAIVLPYFAVILANNSKRRPGETIETPGGVVAVREPEAVFRPTVVDDEGR